MADTKFSCELKIERDADERLISARVSWREGTEINRQLVFGGWMLIAMSVPMLVAGLWLTPLLPVVGGMLIVPGVAILIFGIALQMWPANDREMVFGVDDSVASPLGLKMYKNTNVWRHKASEIVSIEVTRQRDLPADDIRHRVTVLVDEGYTYHVGVDLHEEHAIVVARRLTKALLEVRAAQGAAHAYMLG